MRILSHLNRFPLCLIIIFLWCFHFALAGQSPVISDIPGQTIDEGQVFAAVNLNEFVMDPDNEKTDLSWSYSPEVDLLVSIVDSIASITTNHDENWYGSGTITFTVTDINSNSDSDTAIFNILPVNDPPIVGDIPDTTIDEGSLFNSISLDNYVTDVDNTPDQLTWSASDNTNLAVVINENHIATLTPKNDWIGSETILFTVTDPSKASDIDDALFTIKDVNAAPTDISLSNDIIAENQSSGTLIGTLSTTDPDAGDTHTYSLVAGTGSDDNASFSISGTQLFSAEIFNFEFKNTYSIRIRTTDALAETYEEYFTITVTDANDAPTDISLTASSIAENQPVNTVIGTLSAVDPDAGDTKTYSITSVDGVSSTLFNISGTQLRSGAVFDYETKSSYSVLIRVTDGTGAYYEESFSITVTDANDAPTDISLTASSIAENQPVNTVIGTLSAVDPDAGDTKTYSITSVDGVSSTLFNISGTQLRSGAVFDYETKPSYSVLIRVTDGTGAYYEESFTITVTDANDAPTDISLTASSIAENQPVNTVIGTLSAVDPDAGDTKTYSITSVDGVSSTLFNISGTQLRSGAVFDYETKPSYSVLIRVTDGTGAYFEEAFTIAITNLNDAPVLANIEGTALAYNEGDGLVQITNAITVADVDNTTLASATITISSNYQSDQDILSFTNAPPITGTWNSGTGELSLTGTTTLNNYRNALRSIKYNNTSANPNTTTRTITFLVNDGSDNSNTQTRNITIGASNNAPVLTDPSSSPVSFTENGGSVQLTSTIAVSDADDTQLASATISITSGLQTAEDVLSYTSTGGITGSYNSSTGVLSLSGTTTLANYRTVLRSVRYNNTSENPNVTNRVVSFTVNDGTSASNIINKTVTITAVNDAPVLANIEASPLAYAEGDGAVQITNAIAVADVDNTTLTSATISVSANYQSDQDVLSFTNANGITGSWSSGTGILTLTGTASLSNYQAALRSVTYTNTSANPNTTTRTITFLVNDGTDNSNTQTRNITIGASNNAPVLTDPSSSPVSFTENGGSVQLTSTIAVSDADDTQLASATISITSGLQTAEDVLSYTSTGGITGSYNSSTGVLSLSGTTTLANYRTVLRSVRYNNTSENPNVTNRVVSFTVNDGTSASNIINKTVTITTVNDAPVLANIEASPLAYAEGDGAVQITNAITVADVDNTTLTSATISVSANYQSDQDVLTFTDANGISGNWSSGIGLLTLTGTATLSNYQAALRSVTYTNTSANPLTSTRTINFYVNDGVANSNAQTRDITIGASNNAPVLTDPSSSPVSFTENGGSVQLTNTIAVSDADDTQLASATISITSGLQTAEDVLSYTSTGGITGSYNSSSGVLSLSGTATLLNYRTVLRSVRYNNTSENPNVTNRIVSFTVNDGTSASNTINKTVTITAVNDAPVLANIEAAPLAYAEGDGAVQITNAITVADIDNTTLTSATISVSANYQSDQDVLSFTNANGITGSWSSGTGILTLNGTASLSNYQAALRSVTYTNTSANPLTSTRTINFYVNDGTDNSNTQTRNITIGASNNAPVLANIEGTALAYNEGDGLVQITNAITVTDVDNTTLASATITISSNYQSDQDILSFTNAPPITGTWNSGTGELSLTGTTTLNNYRNALRSIKYNNTSANPNTTTRTITFLVNDGSDNSNTQTRNITIGALNNPPVLTETSSSAVNYTENSAAVLLTNTIAISDADNTQLASATIAITSGFVSGEDTLSFTPGNGITGIYNTSTGILSLSGLSDLVNYQTALRSVRYRNKSEAPTTTNRIISFTVNDGSGVSNIITKTVTITPVNDPPVASGVAITPADARIGIVNTGNFTFTDPDGDFPGTHTYKWYRSDNSSGLPAIAITGATSLTYRPVIADGGKYICFEVTPVDQFGLAGTPVKSAFKYINAAPVASNVHIYAPTAQPGETIRGRFTYYDKESNIRGNAVYHWYRANTVTPTPASPGTAIGTADSTYLLRAADAGKYIWFNVSPVAQSGSSPGDSVWSNVIGPIGEFSANITGSDTFCYGVTMPIILTITAGKAPYTAVLTRSVSTSNKDTTITAIAASPYTIQVKIPGRYVLKSLADANSDLATHTVTPVVLVIYPKPRALLSGTAAICNDGITRATLSLNFTAGTAPWTVTVRRRENQAYDTTFNAVTADPFNFNARVISSTATSHRVIAITDASGCPGDTTSGSAWVSYKTSPVAAISGIDSICPGETANLTVTLTSGTPNWSFTYLRNGANPVTVSGISGYSRELQVTNSGTYTLSGVQDQVCTGRVSGTGEVRAHVVPTALISGTATICEYTSANLNVALTGHTPWKFSYRLIGSDTVEVPNVTSSPSVVSVQQEGTYTLYEVFDKNCKGTVSGNAVINMIQAPEVKLSGLDPAYNKESGEWVTLTGTPSGGTFSGPGVVPYNNIWYFIPGLPPVGTHNIIYSYRASPSSCYGYDTSVVRVLEADAVIEFENNRTKYCLNDRPFTITGANTANDTGSFIISGNVGLTDHHNNTATINPALLSKGEYTITYYYEYLGRTFPWPSKFDVGNSPTADFNWASECFQAGQSIALNNTSTSYFGNLIDTLFFWKIYNKTGYIADTAKNITHTFAEPGNHSIELQIQNSYGCTDTVNKELPLRPTISLDGKIYFENFDASPIGWRSGKSPTETVNSWQLGTPSKHGEPGSPLLGFSGAKTPPNCWYTSIPTNPAPTEHSWVTSPCFDFTGTEKPMVKLDIWRLFNSQRDGANLQASADNGKTWMLIGQLGDGVNWYNSYAIDGKPGPDGSGIGWSNKDILYNDVNWVEARHSLDMLKGKTSVQFRISYGSANLAQNNDGIAFDDFSIVERNRTALIEHFTNSSSDTCAVADLILDKFVNDYPQNVIDLQYHTSNPSNDPFYEDNPVIPTTREFYYGLSGVPYALINGGSKSQHRFDYTPLSKNTAIIESLLDSKFQIVINKQVHDNTLNIETEVSALDDVPLTEISVRIAVIERVINGITGDNGDTSFRSVVKAMLPSAAGTTIYKAWSKGEYRYINQSWDMENVYNPMELRIVAFIQNESTHEIYQATLDTSDIYTGIDNPLPGSPVEKSFIVYPNPAERSAYIKFNQETVKGVTIELYNNLGRLVYFTLMPAGTDMAEIPVEDYPDGFYLLRLMSNEKLIGTSKLIISK